MSFKENDRVRVTATTHSQLGQMGTVGHVYSDKVTFRVQMDNGNSSGFFESELELVDAKREALIELAETLDKARLQANAINGTDGDIYRKISEPLYEVLGIIMGDETEGYEVYNDMIESGNTVREALKAVEK